MGLLSGLKSLFSSGPAEEPAAKQHDAVEYSGYTIIPAPQPANGGYRVSGIIRKGEQEHQFIRSDTCYSEDDCVELTLTKARQTIDQLGDRIF